MKTKGQLNRHSQHNEQWLDQETWPEQSCSRNQENDLNCKLQRSSSLYLQPKNKDRSLKFRKVEKWREIYVDVLVAEDSLFRQGPNDRDSQGEGRIRQKVFVNDSTLYYYYDVFQDFIAGKSYLMC